MCARTALGDPSHYANTRSPCYFCGKASFGYKRLSPGKEGGRVIKGREKEVIDRGKGRMQNGRKESYRGVFVYREGERARASSMMNRGGGIV